MTRPDDWLERSIDGFVRRVSGRSVAILAVAFYPGLGLVLPLVFDWTRNWLFAANAIGVGSAAVLSMSWFVAQLEIANRRRLLEWTTELRHLNAEEFEWLVGELFRREGWTVRETGRQDSADGGIDLELTKGDVRRLVQCKRWTSKHIRTGDVRAFAGTLLREGLPGSQGVLVTLSQFNTRAEQEAKRSGIELIDGRELFRRIERVRRPEPCPTCSAPMVLDRSPHGWWFRCIASGCAGKRDLDRDPARAAELLTSPSATATVRGGQ